MKDDNKAALALLKGRIEEYASRQEAAKTNMARLVQHVADEASKAPTMISSERMIMLADRIRVIEQRLACSQAVHEELAMLHLMLTPRENG